MKFSFILAAIAACLITQAAMAKQALIIDKDAQPSAKASFLMPQGQQGCRKQYMGDGGQAPFVAKKPVIYLYPPQQEDVSVKLFFLGHMTSSYPPYDTTSHGWNVTAYPDGHMVNLADNETYNYLFWEGVPDAPWGLGDGKGFVVASKDTAAFLARTLKQMGMTPHETNEFIVYWLPQMEKNAFNLIHFAGKEYNDTACLSITPKPDSLLRVFMMFKPLKVRQDIIAQDITPFTRTGFTVVEWGGAELK